MLSKILAISVILSGIQSMAIPTIVGKNSLYNKIDFSKGFVCTGNHSQNERPITITFDSFKMGSYNRAEGPLKGYTVGNKEYKFFQGNPDKNNTYCDAGFNDELEQAMSVSKCEISAVDTTDGYDENKEYKLSASLIIYAAVPVSKDEQSVTFLTAYQMNNVNKDIQHILGCKFQLTNKATELTTNQGE